MKMRKVRDDPPFDADTRGILLADRIVRLRQGRMRRDRLPTDYAGFHNDTKHLPRCDIWRAPCRTIKTSCNTTHHAVH